MPTNDFIGFASAGSANIMSQADYAAAAEQTDGVQPGPASSALANKIWRQGANMAAALGRMIAAQGLNALDDGDIASLLISLTTAVQGSIVSTTTSPRSLKVKFPNGLMIQCISDSFITSSVGRITWIFPESYIEKNFCFVLPQTGGQYISQYSSTTSEIVLRCTDANGSGLPGGTSVAASIVAIGRWA